MAEYSVHLGISCPRNPGAGSYATVVSKLVTGKLSQTTNVRLELQAIIEALKTIPTGSNVQVHTNSKFLYNSLDKWIYHWKKNNWNAKTGELLANVDLFKQIDQLLQDRFLTIVYERQSIVDLSKVCKDQAIRLIKK